MIHNKYHLILKQFLGDYSREVYGRGLVNQVPLSQKAIALTLDALEKQGVLRSRRQGNLKYFGLNLADSEIKDLLINAETLRKIEFFKKYRKIANIFRQDERIMGIFGSYASGTERRDSDVDLFIIGKKTKKDYDKKGSLFDIKISIKYFSEKEFMKLIREKNNLCKEIIKNHVLIFNAEKFVNMIWGAYYGFD